MIQEDNKDKPFLGNLSPASPESKGASPFVLSELAPTKAGGAPAPSAYDFGLERNSGTAPAATPKNSDLSLMDVRAAKQEQLERPAMDKDLGFEAGSSLARGVMSIAKMPFELGKFAADVVGAEGASRGIEQKFIGPIEAVTSTPEMRPGTKAGGPEISLDRLAETGGAKAVWQQIKDNVTNPHFWAANLPEGFTSLAPTLGAAKATAWVGRAGKLAKEAQALGAAGKLAEAAVVEEKLAKVLSLSQKMTYATGIAMETADAAQRLREWEAKNNTKVDWVSRVGSVLGSGIISGSLEAFSVDKIFGGKAGEKLAMKILDAVGIEGGTEGAQTLVQNACAKIGYDPEAKLTEGIVESVIIGAAVGGGAGGMNAAATRIKGMLDASKAEQAGGIKPVDEPMLSGADETAVTSGAPKQQEPTAPPATPLEPPGDPGAGKPPENPISARPLLLLLRLNSCRQRHSGQGLSCQPFDE